MDEDLFLTAFKKSAVGMALIDETGLILQANPALQKILERDITRIEGRYLEDSVPPDEARHWRHFFDEFISGVAKDYYFESEFLPLHSRDAWWSIQLGDLERKQENGKRVYFAVVQDITLKKVNEYRLRDARINAERASRAKSQFLANMSHEIRTPLHTITGMAELLNESPLDEEQSDYAHQISISADILLSLINDVLDFSKIEAGRMVLETVPFDLFRIVDESIEMVAYNAFNKGLQLITHIEGRVPHLLEGDPHRLRQVLLNLLNNSVKFTEKGEVVLTVRVLEDPPGDATFQVSVRDTGIGMTPDQKANLFEAFSQGDSSTTRKYGGTGLGLAISNRLVKLLGGSFHVTSEPDLGAEFSFTFRMPKQNNPDLYASIPSNFFESKKLLLVQCNSTSVDILRGYLTSWGCEVSVALTASEALNLLKNLPSNHFNLILVDEDLSDRSGWSLGEELRAETGTLPPLILLAAFGKKSDSSRMKHLKLFEGYLSKPVRRQDLFEIVWKGFNGNLDLELAELQDPLAPKNVRHVRSPDYSNNSVLVAEDNDVNRELFALHLSKLGYNVLSAPNGEEAVRVVQERNPLLVFMDLQMPIMNGYEAAKKIRTLGSKVPIVAVTASALKGEMERCLQAGMNDLITKPFRMPDLVRLLNQLFGDSEYKTYYDSVQPKALDKAILPIFSWTDALEVFLGKKELLTKLLGNFEGKVTEHLAHLEDHVQTGNLEGVFQEAHAIKGSAYNLTAQELGEAAGLLEMAGRNGEGARIGPLLENLQQAFERFSNYIKDNPLV